MSNSNIRLFQKFGIELEYMIVNNDSLNVLPVADEVIKAVTNEYVSDADLGKVEWSNELVLHVIEIKTKEPEADLASLPKLFHDNILHINSILEKQGGKLLSTAMHPWMNPEKEMKLWPHDNSAIYGLYDKIFNCSGHGWSNLQSVHINLPFGDDEEFGRLHAAVRLVLPLIPALAASSPIKEKMVTGYLDSRLEVYRKNQSRVPSIAGHIIPEAVFTRSDYEEKIFNKIYADIDEHDKEGILKYEWLNSRGAIARFDRNAIEIRLIDIQECPAADIAIAAFVIELVKALVNEEWLSYKEQKEFLETELSDILLQTIQRAEHSVIKHEKYLKAFNIHYGQAPASDVLSACYHLLKTKNELMPFQKELEIILAQGTLSSRILRAVNIKNLEESLPIVYNSLSNCLTENKIFTC